jgi:hypothetical protein
VVSGTHRGKPNHRVLITLLAVVVVAVAVIGFIIYLPITHASVILILAGVLDAVIVLQATHRMVLNLASSQVQSAEDAVNRLSLMAQLVGAVVVLLVCVGQLRGWMHGMFRDLIDGVLVLYLIGSPIYWFGGKRRLIAMLSTRAPGGEAGS